MPLFQTGIDEGWRAAWYKLHATLWYTIRLAGGRFIWKMKLMLRSTSLGDQRLKCFPLQPAFWTRVVVVFYVSWLICAHVGVSVIIRVFQLEVQVELAAGALFASALCFPCSLKYDMNIWVLCLSKRKVVYIRWNLSIRLKLIETRIRKILLPPYLLCQGGKEVIMTFERPTQYSTTKSFMGKIKSIGVFQWANLQISNRKKEFKASWANQQIESPNVTIFQS